MTEQLSMFEESSNNQSKKNSMKPLSIEAPEYAPLDEQLATLMLELYADATHAQDKVKDDDNSQSAQEKTIKKVLKQCTLTVSQRTREGCIASYCTPEQQSLLLRTNVVGKAGAFTPLILEDDHLYLNRYWQYQHRLAHQISTRMKNAVVMTNQQQEWMKSRLQCYFPKAPDEKEQDINWQKKAASLALLHKFLIVSGGPGTGKTTTITRVLALMIEKHLYNVRQQKKGKKVEGAPTSFSRTDNLTIRLAAPTGKAAIRMLDSLSVAIKTLKTQLNEDDTFNAVMEQMPSEASTLHKLLGYQAHKTQFKHDREHPLHADIVLVDEASMIDIALMTKLLEAVPDHATLILMGDKDQLASVETGSVFADLCHALDEDEHLVTLKKNWRFSADSAIGHCAVATNKGDSRTLLQLLKSQDQTQCDLVHPNTINDNALIQPWLQYFSILNNPASSIDDIFLAFNQYRILCALRRGYNGSEIMNKRIESAFEKLNLVGRQRHNSSAWYHGRPIMITQNSYHKGLMNGDTGIALIKDGELAIYFPDAQHTSILTQQTPCYKSISPIRLPMHETTWAMTIHKSQGSEFNRVVLILPEEEMPLLTKQLIYTGITRAKDSVCIIASDTVVEAGVKTDIEPATRISFE